MTQLELMRDKISPKVGRNV